MTHDAAPVLTRTSGPLHAGGTVAYEVRLDGRWIGWVGDARDFDGSRFRGRRWWACWRQGGDEHARWSSGPVYRTRRAALDALLRKARRAFLDAAYAAHKRELAEATTPEAYEAAAAQLRDHETARRIVGLPVDIPEETR